MHNPLDLNDEEVSQILADVRQSLNHLVKSEKALLKADGDDDGTPPPGVGDEASGGAPPGGDAPPMGDEASGSAPPGADAAAAGADGDPAANDGPVDPAQLQAEYAKLPLDQLKAHAEAAMGALQAAMGGAGGAAPPPPGAGAPPAAAEGSAPTMKSEMGSKSGSGGEMAKSEKRLAELEADLKEKDVAIELLVKSVSTIMKQPMRKSEAFSIPSGRKSAKDEPSHADVKAKLTLKVKDKSLTKKDREVIDRVFCNGAGSYQIAEVAHLLG